MSQWQRIYEYLKNSGFEVYSPGQHKGDCISKYVVLKDEGAQKMLSFSSTQVLYDVLCYVPGSQFSSLEPFVEEVKTCLAGMYPELIPTYVQNTSFYDDTVQGHMISLQYRSSHKI